MDLGINITGLAEVQRMLRDAPKDIVALGFARAVSAGGNVIANELEIRTPVKAEDTGGILDKGELRESIMIRYEMDAGLRWAAAQVGFRTSNGADSAALWVEFGHRMVGHRPGLKVLGFVPAYPFMRPAADASIEPAMAAVAESLRETVRTLFPQGGSP